MISTFDRNIDRPLDSALLGARGGGMGKLFKLFLCGGNLKNQRNGKNLFHISEYHFRSFASLFVKSSSTCRNSMPWRIRICRSLKLKYNKLMIDISYRAASWLGGGWDRDRATNIQRHASLYLSESGSWKKNRPGDLNDSKSGGNLLRRPWITKLI